MSDEKVSYPAGRHISSISFPSDRSMWDIQKIISDYESYNLKKIEFKDGQRLIYTVDYIPDKLIFGVIMSNTNGDIDSIDLITGSHPIPLDTLMSQH